MVFGRYNELIRTINHGGFVMVIWMVNHIYMDGLWMFMVDITNYKSWGFCDGKKKQRSLITGFPHPVIPII